MGKGKVTITNTIRRQRFDADEMTQKDLAEKIGVTRQTVVAIEKAKYGPSLELAFQIARVFGKPLEEVFQVHFDDDETTTD
ncbi:MAG: helix-turn-helix transcriptional regulator [Alphaproteobacteria bacterium]